MSSEPFSDDRFSKYGWDKDSFFYPERNSKTLLLLGFLTVVLIHFSEIFGLATTEILFFGFLPAHFTYHLLHAFLALLFTYVVYKKFPEDLDK